MKTADARSFYEIEAANNHWSARELERQISSLLFERLAKSKDKTINLRHVLKASTEVMAFALSEYVAHESGLLAVTVMGIWLANARNLDVMASMPRH